MILSISLTFAAVTTITAIAASIQNHALWRRTQATNAYLEAHLERLEQPATRTMAQIREQLSAQSLLSDHVDTLIQEIKSK